MAEQTKSGGSGIARKLLMPLLATAVSAAATYAGKRAPRLLEEKVMPKLRDATSGGGDLASGLADRAKSVVGRGDDNDGDGDGGGGGSRGSGSRRSFSNDELEKRRRERAEQRASRREAVRGARS